MEARQPLLGICSLIAIVSTPLILKLVGVNSFYGLRTPQTLASSDVWYAANSFAGWTFLIAAVVSAGLLLFAPGASRTWISVIYFVAPVSVALCAALAYASNLS